MRILIDALSQVGAGMRTYLYHVLYGLAQNDPNNAYDVLWPSYIPVPGELLRSTNLSFRAVNVPQKPAALRTLYEQAILPWAAGKYDLLFAPGDIGPLACSCPVVVTVHNPNPFFDMPRPFFNQVVLWLKKNLVKLSARNAAHVVFVSEHSRANIVPQIGLPLDKTSVIYHGVDQNRFDPNFSPKNDDPDIPLPAPRQEYILCVSTITHHKNYEMLLRGYAQLPIELRRNHPLVIVGRVSEGKYYHHLHDLAAQLTIERDVRFVGKVAYSDIPNIYRGAHVYVLPSLTESFGLTLIEAMAMGIPVVASRATCIPEIVGNSGLLFDPYSPSDLSQQLEQLLVDGELRRSLIEAGLSRARQFSWDQSVKKLIDLFGSSASNGRKGRILGCGAVTTNAARTPQNLDTTP